MRSILIAINSLAGGGAERVAVNLAEHWINAGHSVTLVTWASPRSDIYQINHKVTRISLELDRPANSHFHALASNLHRTTSMRKAIKDSAPDLVVSLMTSMNVVVALSGVGLPCKTILCEHNYPPRSTSSAIWKTARKFTYQLADLVVALNKDGSNWLLENTYAKSVTTVPNAIVWPLPTSEPCLKPDSFVARNRKFVLNAGSLTGQKDHRRLIESFAIVAPKYPDWDLVIIGEGPLRKQLNQLCQKLSLSDRIIMPGWAGNIGDWYQAANIYALSSEYEGFPLTLLEAMAAGKAVVSVNCKTGPEDILTDGFNGLLVNQETASLSNGLDRLMGDEPLRNTLSINALDVTSRYSEESVMRLWDRIFDKLLHKL